MPFSNFPNGFANGVAIRGMPILNGYGGNIFWVDSGSGSNNNDGTHVRPYSTLDFAVGKCTANNGDVIIVKAGHTETVTAAGGLDLDVAGITIMGLGNGSDRPTVNFTTAVGADMDVGADNITISNFLFTGGIDALTGPIDINAADFTMLDCETKDVTGQATDFIVADTNANRLMIDGWTHRGAAAAGGASALQIVGGDGATVRNFFIDGNFDTAAIENVTTAATNLTINGGANGSYIRNRNSADVCFTAVATTTGNVGPNIYARIADNAANITEAFVGADMQFFQPIAIANADGEVGLNTNITASTDA
tara:strand:- start:30366 stop:31292 length:927 start_codon:yes stop_codon:yes gene_type:complete